MPLYAFQLGRKSALCKEELIALLGKSQLVDETSNIAIFKLKENLNPEFQDKLGGTIKVMEIFAELPRDNREKEITQAIQEHLEKTFKEHQGKLQFAISVFSYKELNIKNLLNFSKKFLKSLGLSSRFVNKDLRNNVKPATIYKAKVIEKGIDLNIIKGRKLYLGQSISVQDLDAYSFRDYDKPCRDARVGMLPPKLAQIMINLAGPEIKTIYDPFCGTGTILMEAMLMQKNAIGSDIEEKLVQYTEKNCEWLEEKFQTKTSYRTFTRDAQYIGKELLPEQLDSIVTESYLGPPQTKEPTQHEQEKIFRELGNLHFNWFTQAHKILPQNAKLITCIPCFRIKNKYVHMLDMERISKETGFSLVNSFIYDRPDQIVAREILILSRS